MHWQQVDFCQGEERIMEQEIKFSPTRGNINTLNYFTPLSRRGGQLNQLNYTFSGSAQPADIFALAKAFLTISEMTNKKLQKLCYYAKAWHLALYDENLIEEQFQAWVHGAVQPALYQLYKPYGFSEIKRVDSFVGIPETFLDFAREIYSSYGHLSGDELERLNHQEDPWIIARGGCKPWESCTTEISEEDMKSYYRRKMQIY